MENVLIKESGYFWWRNEPIPEGDIIPDSSVTGDLIISDDGRITLELHGYFTSDVHPLLRIFEGAGNSCPDIEGRLKNSSEHVLLKDVYTRGGKAAFGGISYESYGATSCLIGSASFPSLKGEIKFDSISIPLNGFEHWLDISSIETTRTAKKLIATHKMQKDIKYAADGCGILSIEFDLLAPMFGKQKCHTLNIDEKINFKYLTKFKKSSSEMKEYFSSISDLLLILTCTDYSMDWPLITIGRTKKVVSHISFIFQNLEIQPFLPNVMIA